MDIGGGCFFFSNFIEFYYIVYGKVQFFFRIVYEKKFLEQLKIL